MPQFKLLSAKQPNGDTNTTKLIIVMKRRNK